MGLNKLLLRQLNRAGLSQESLPQDIKQWQEFIEHINRVYIEADQERYLLERSMDISSRELLELNEKLENAQHIAGLGYWFYDSDTKEIVLSKELQLLLGINLGNASYRFENFLQTVYAKDQALLTQLIDRVISEGEPSECELRIHSAEGDYRWHYIIAYPFHRKEKSCRKLSGIFMDVTKRRNAEEVTNSILHNVGNVLNSANVSVELLSENIHGSHYKKLFILGKILRDNIEKIYDFLTNDSKGKLVSQYLPNLIAAIEEEFNDMVLEVSNLTKQINHIREIVTVHQSMKSVFGTTERVYLPDTVDIALNMCGRQLEESGIEIEKKYEEIPFTILNKSKLFQILINLIQNAKDALIENTGNINKKLTLCVKKNNEANKVDIFVKDNGIGIATENINSIFSLGFTSKNHGHGLGLHSSALAAKEIGGELNVKSEGIGKGATFILTLPLNSDNLTEGK